jgi:adenylate cyclase
LAERRFAQFFGPELAAELARNPNLLDGRGEQVTMVFADVRGFSRVSEKLSPAETVQWLGDIVNELSDAVTDEGGVVVDYVGDEVVAMWGAPKPQPDHAARATRAALGMLARLPALNARWTARIGEECRLGVGVNSGSALVGNIGSTQKFKYGALGNTVNLASRVQGMTRFLKVPLLVTGETRAALGPEFLARRVCQARVVNIGQPVALYEVATADSGDAEFFQASEAALVALEEQRFPEAARMAGELLGRHPGDGPLQLVLSRAAVAILEDGKGFDPVWTPPGK